MPKKLDKQTIVARSAIADTENYGDVTPPHHSSVSFAYNELNEKPSFAYGRVSNPNSDMLGDAIAKLEGGYGAVVTSSGMAALDLAFHVLDRDDIVVASHDCYGGTQRLLRERSEKQHFKLKYVDFSDGNVLDDLKSIKPKMILVETPSNPLLKVYDLKKIAEIAQSIHAITCVDNTFLSPILQNPIALGCDLVMHSTTKYMNGHSDVIGGALVSRTQDLHDKMIYWANCVGSTASSHDSWMILRGLRTLDVRIKRQQSNAQAIAEFLESHQKIAKVYYPGLKTHREYDLAKRQQRGAGAMISFEIKDADIDTMKKFIACLSFFPLAQSLGGYDSMINHPMSMTHASMGRERCESVGITEGLLRLSIGLENADDLIEDIGQALEKI